MKSKTFRTPSTQSGCVAGWLWFGIFSLIVVDSVWAVNAQISIANWGLVCAGISVFVLVWLFYGISGRNTRLADMGQYAAAWIIFGLAGSIFSYCNASLALPLLDAGFVRWDAFFGFHWKKWWDTIIANPTLAIGLAYFYSSLPAQMCIAIIYFSHKSLPERNRELLWIAMVSGVFVSLISGLMPARGAFDYFGIREYATHLSVLSALRESGAHEFSLSKVEGIVTFPSYHTAMAIYFTYIFRGHRILFWIFAVVNALILLSVFTHGGHYLVDVVSGALVTTLSIYIVRQFSGRFSKMNQLLPN